MAAPVRGAQLRRTARTGTSIRGRGACPPSRCVHISHYRRKSLTLREPRATAKAQTKYEAMWTRSTWPICLRCCPVARHNRAVPGGLCLLGRRRAVPTPEPPHSSELIFPLDGHPCTRLLFWMHGISLFPWHMRSDIFISSPLGSRFRIFSLRRLHSFYSESSPHSALELRTVVPVLVSIRRKIATSSLL